jgi:hypothetical protein
MIQSTFDTLFGVNCFLFIKVNLSCNNIDDDGASHIASILRENSRIKYLDISNNCISALGFTKMIRAMVVLVCCSK